MKRTILILAIVVFLFLAVVLGYAVNKQVGTSGINVQKKACTDSGGIVSAIMCCKSVTDFPNTCLIGACGCSLENSRNISVCDCGPNKCFNGTSCYAAAGRTVPPLLMPLPTSGRTSIKFNISIANFAFNPKNTTIAIGNTVVWTNTDDVVHRVVADNGFFDSGNLTKGQTFTYAFPAPGIYAYHCAIHPSMTGTIIVK